MYTLQAPPYLERVLACLPAEVERDARAELLRVLQLAEGGFLSGGPICAARCKGLCILCQVEPQAHRVVVRVVLA